MRTRFLIMIVAGCGPLMSMAQLYVGPSSSLYIPAGAVLQVDSLTLQPAATLRLANNTIRRSSTPEWAPGAGHASILQVYEIDTPLNFTGTAGITYAAGSLNGNAVGSLHILLAPELPDTLRAAGASLHNLATQTVAASFGSAVRIAKLSAAGTAAPLPLEVLSFDARKDGRQRARLDWSVAKAAPGDLFLVQRSGDGTSFSDLLQVPARVASGPLGTYTEFDEAPLEGLNVYRLVTLDASGRISHHGARSLIFGPEEPVIAAWPVPADDALNLSFSQTPSASAMLTLYDMAGRKSMRVSVTGPQMTLSLSQLAAGSYIVQYDCAETRISFRIEKQ